jgi:hypothetical protein
MNCAEFDAVLSGLLAASDGSPDPRLASLRAHASVCAACSPASDLIELAARPAGERDPVDDPGAPYWDDFGARLDARLDREHSASHRRLAIGGGLAAAVIVAAGLLVGFSRRHTIPGPTAATPPASTFRSETPGDLPPVDAVPAIDDDLMEGFAGAEPLDAFSEDDAGGLFPAADQLAPADAERLLEWLRREESRVRKGAA